jgi:hypothetical protein
MTFKQDLSDMILTFPVHLFKIAPVLGYFYEQEKLVRGETGQF